MVQIARPEAGPATPRDDEEPRFRLILWAVALVALIAAIPPLIGVPLHISRDFGEGFNAYWARAAATGGTLYSATRAFTADNYPPLYFYFDGGLGRLFGDEIVAGRVVAVLCQIAVAGEIALIVTMLGGARRWAAMTALVFLLYDTVFFSQFVAINNPQWPGQALMLASVLPLMRREGPRPAGLVLCAATMCVAGLIKHNQFAMPTAVAIWLLWRDRRGFAVWAVSIALIAAAACALLYARFGSAVFVEIIRYRRTSDVSGFLAGLRRMAELAPLIWAAGLAWVRQRRDDPRIALIALFAAIGLVSGIGQRLGAGVFINAHFDALIGMTLLAGTLPARAAAGLVAQGPTGKRCVAILWLILASAIVMTPLRLAHVVRELYRLPQDRRDWSAMIAEVRAAPGPVPCEHLSVCFWAGKPLFVDFFTYGQKLRTGDDPAAFANTIAARRWSVMIVERSKHYHNGTGRLPDLFRPLIEANYRVRIETKDHVALMRPR